MKAYFYTFGCKVNQYETQAMRDLLEQSGFSTASYSDIASNSNGTDTEQVFVINSCTVTSQSDRKLRQITRRIRRQHSDSIIVLTGCMPQVFPDKANDLPADIVIGNSSRNKLPYYINKFLNTRMPIVDIEEHQNTFEPLQITSFQGRTRAYVKIQDGCNCFCSYCIIPHARGRIRSKPIDDIFSELTALANAGHSEVVLVGINLTAYGAEWGLTLADAVECACKVKGLTRIRLGSLEPDRVDNNLIQRLAQCHNLCAHFHMSLQSGCDYTLSRMNRNYTSSQYYDIVKMLRESFSGCALTTDVMVGFPGETEEEFKQSYDFVKKVGFSQLHVFSYSKRPGTKAAKMLNQVDAQTKAARSQKLTLLGNTLHKTFLNSFLEQDVSVLLEVKNQNNNWQGYNPQYVEVEVDNLKEGKSGMEVCVHVDSHDNFICRGHV